MKKLIVALILGTPLVAYASGQLAPQQATKDMEDVCSGPVWSVYLLDRGSTTFEEATGVCYDFRTGHGVTLLQWARNRTTGARLLLRQGIDSSYHPVDTVPPLTCVKFGGFELCR
jgi:hypothetical protein